MRYLLVFRYFFSAADNVIAAPFSALLAEQLESRLTDYIAHDNVSVNLCTRYAIRVVPRMSKVLLSYSPER
ncbi:MAG: hypothetical protein ACTXOO_03125 [Sodalis sp. (in: enterobacteria)]